jgi:release factor glutamine methyltransferase
MNRAGGLTILGLLRDAAARLSDIDAGNPRLEAEYLLAHALGIERPVLLGLDSGMAAGPDAEAGFSALLARRLAREPLQYVLGTVPFAGLDLVIGPGALIPRGETEVLVEHVAAALRVGDSGGPSAASGSPSSAGPGRERGGGAPLNSPDSRREGSGAPLLVDLGTGSGAIVLALLGRLRGWRGIGVDRSSTALAWARRNRATVGERSCDFLRGDLLASVRTGVVDAVVSNPPYIRSAEIPDLAPEIREHEPPEALDGGADGLDPFRRLVGEAARVLRPGGLFAVELAPDQPDQASELLAASGAFHAARIFIDLAGRKRGILAWRR